MKSIRTAGFLLLALAAAGFSQDGPKKIPKGEVMSSVQSKVQPDYPTIAKQLKIEGAVELEATVADNGTVEDVKIVSGNPVLTKPAAEALKKWKFTPFTANGKPVRAVAPVTMSFSYKM